MSGSGSRSPLAWAGGRWRNFRMRCRNENLIVGGISTSAFRSTRCTFTTGLQR